MFLINGESTERNLQCLLVLHKSWEGEIYPGASMWSLVINPKSSLLLDFETILHVRK